MSGNATRKLNEATEAFMGDLEGARETMMRIAQIQAKMSQTMDECLAEFRALFRRLSRNSCSHRTTMTIRARNTRKTCRG